MRFSPGRTCSYCPRASRDRPSPILEAQRMGCVPVATRTGAVHEMVSDGADGFLIPTQLDPAVASGFAERLAALSADRAALRAAARAAATHAVALPGWERHMTALLDRLDKVPSP
ncbi:glycosyltransferase [Roseomonas harenae]|uniref:glycosyltransferase n=1 Tax=Muricoccus harenae TaxID=2692566 RepID=UPI0038B42358